MALIFVSGDNKKVHFVDSLLENMDELNREKPEVTNCDLNLNLNVISI